MSYAIEDVKANLTSEDIYNLLEYYNADPQWRNNDDIVCLTICHQGDSRKLYYYGNSKLFQCYTHCGSFDVVELVKKVSGYSTNDAVNFLVDFFHLNGKIEESDTSELSEDFRIFQEWNELSEYKAPAHELIELPEHDIHFLGNYPDATPEMVDQKISQKVLKHYGTKLDPIEGAWVVPHTDQNGRIVGVRQRTLRESQEQYGKYRPWRNYTHPLSMNLFSDNYFWKNISKSRTAVLFEAEKSVMMYSTYYGIKNNCACALCSSNFSEYQLNLLLAFGAENIIVGFDRDYLSSDSDNPEFQRYMKKIYNVWRRYSSRVNLSFIIDRKDQLGLKDSPTDKGKEVFQSLLDDRQTLTEDDFKEMIDS